MTGAADAGGELRDGRSLDGEGRELLVVRRVTDRSGLEACWRIRFAVFVDEQQVPAEMEVDDLDTDPGTSHVLAVLTGVGVGAGAGDLGADTAALADAGAGAGDLGADTASLADAGADVTELPVATARLLPEQPGVVRIGRVAVLREARGTGAGRAVMHALHQLAVAEHAGPDGAVRVDIEAQEHAIPFYAGLGYALVDERRYLDAGIWHRDMVLHLTR